MMNKPLVRWIIGNPGKYSIAVLASSVKHWKRLYGNLFRTMICHNNLTTKQKVSLPLVDEIIDQDKFRTSLPIPPDNQFNPAWKLYPPRLSPETHEIIMDNDVVFYKKPPAIDQFLGENSFLTTEGLGSYSPSLPQPTIQINTGVLGLPPGFDFAAALNEMIPTLNGIWSSHFDEQTLTALILQDKTRISISLDDLWVASPKTECKRGQCGIHFCGLNSGFDSHWENFCRISVL